MLRVLALGWPTWALTPQWLMRDAALAMAIVMPVAIVAAVLLVRRRARDVVQFRSGDIHALPGGLVTPAIDDLEWVTMSAFPQTADGDFTSRTAAAKWIAGLEADPVVTS